MPVIPLNSANDSRLEPYRDVKDRDLTGRQGLFMAEGKVVLERLFASPLCETVSVLTTPARLEGLSVSDDVLVYLVEQAVMDQVAGFPIHRGYLALGRYAPPRTLGDILARAGRLRILALSAIANTDNMGGLMRNAAAFGVDAVVLDAACCDPLYRKAIRVSVGGALVVPHYRLNAGESLLDVLSTHNLIAYALSPTGDMVLDQVVPAERSAFLLGAEGPGLSCEILDAAISVQIPMHGGFDSLNVATTSGIVLYHLCR
ncbi:TrmH family RNA methyltransferase [Asticcacaulis machinosus]|uniref:RNA methyltransferase n=1 Tax=Asticcacaulis machinosus TaxID=2984211 RepID=A0ABT5HI80_9CAUL|nr:RNA methyltransferase [Asticcacaulis machinosus]MDC7675951.1 RNA methyltransferase [Asticcacaulis machinosus]